MLGVYVAFETVCCDSLTAVIVLEVPDAGSVALGYEWNVALLS